MPARTPEMRETIARAGAAARWGKADSTDRRRDLAAERLAQHIERVVSAAPALTAEQRDRLATLLRRVPRETADGLAAADQAQHEAGAA